MTSDASSLIVMSALGLLILLFLIGMWYFFHGGYPRKLPDHQQQKDSCEKAVLKNSFKSLGLLVLPERIIVSQDHLGSGQFGAVYAGIAQLPNEQPGKFANVAVKMPNSFYSPSAGSNVEESEFQLLKEAKAQAQLKHPHIVQVLAVCVKHPVMVIMERLKLSLIDYLLLVKEGKKAPLELRHIIRLLRQVAQAGAHMHSMDYTHRDVAARNIMLTEENIGKADAMLGDFGMSRQLYHGSSYYRMSDRLLPIAWSAPEVIQNGTACPKSDVWMFGVTMWECFTVGDVPRDGLAMCQLVAEVTSPDPCHRYLPRPATLCATNRRLNFIWDLMKRCWSLSPLDRPKFAELDEHLSDVATSLATCHHRILISPEAQQSSRPPDEASTYLISGDAATSDGKPVFRLFSSNGSCSTMTTGGNSGTICAAAYATAANCHDGLLVTSETHCLSQSSDEPANHLMSDARGMMNLHL